ncbi:LamG domain-containing protein [Verrucomicrobia bacterium]|nr:LamG domain-containing protein [Verrucomicrobiota bacterium]
MEAMKNVFCLFALLPLIAAAQPAWIDDGLVAYYPFGGEDSFPVERSLQIVDGFKPGTKATSFNGTDAYVKADLKASQFNQFDSLSVGFWVRFDDHENNKTLTVFDIWHGTTNTSGMEGKDVGLLYQIGPNKVVWGTKAGGESAGSALNANYSISAGTDEDYAEWVHLYAIWDFKDAIPKFKFFANGKHVPTLDTELSFNEFNSIGQNLFIGGHNSWYDRDDGNNDNMRFGGLGARIAAFRIYNRALSATEISQLHAYESQPQSSSNTGKASAMAQVVNGFIVGAEIIDGGYGYTSIPEVTMTGGGGSGVVATATLTNGQVTGINILNPGIGYTSAPTVSIAAPPELAPSGYIKAVKKGLGIELTINTEQGAHYQLQRTADLFDWEDDGDVITGRGEPIKIMRGKQQAQRFWRVVVNP